MKRNSEASEYLNEGNTPAQDAEALVRSYNGNAKAAWEDAKRTAEYYQVHGLPGIVKHHEQVARFIDAWHQLSTGPISHGIFSTPTEA